MGRKIVIFMLITFSSLNISAQFTKYVVKFKDKAGSPFSINDPSKYLSQRAISRRAKQNIAIDETDLPVNPSYIDSIRTIPNVTVLDESKWFNQVCIATSDPVAIQKINQFSFVITTAPVKRLASTLTGNRTGRIDNNKFLSLIHISEPTRQAEISYAVFCLKK